MDLNNLRREYTLYQLDKKSIAKFPFSQFEIWLNQAIKSEVLEPNAMILSTCTANFPSQRVVLLKECNNKGFVFFTNYNSKKGLETKLNPNVSILFPWLILQRQVIIKGKISKIPQIESENYFATRPKTSQLGAWASHQSNVVENREFLNQNFKEVEKKYTGKTIPMPEYWGGYIIEPSFFEFWQGRENRLHDRITYSKRGENDWKIERLNP